MYFCELFMEPIDTWQQKRKTERNVKREKKNVQFRYDEIISTNLYQCLFFFQKSYL